MDLNNISPKETLEINKHINNFVDRAIIGKIDSANPILYLSGKNLESLDFLNDFWKFEKSVKILVMHLN